MLGTISTQVKVTLCIGIAFLSWVLWGLLRGPKYRGMNGLLAQTEPGLIRSKHGVFDRNASVLLVCGMFGQCVAMLYSEAGKPRAVVPTYFAATMLPQLLKRWSEPRVAGAAGGVAAAAGVAGR